MTTSIIRDCHVPHHGACDAVLREDTVIETVRSHGFEVRLRGGVVEAWEPSFTLPLDGVSPPFDSSSWVSVPHEVHALAAWLGY